MYGCPSHAPYWGPGPKPRHVPWLGIEPATLWFIGQCSVHWVTPAGVHIMNISYIFFCGVQWFWHFLKLDDVLLSRNQYTLRFSVIYAFLALNDTIYIKVNFWWVYICIILQNPLSSREKTRQEGSGQMADPQTCEKGFHESWALCRVKHNPARLAYVGKCFYKCH